jgi:hypothetical protein
MWIAQSGRSGALRNSGIVRRSQLIEARILPKSRWPEVENRSVFRLFQHSPARSYRNGDAMRPCHFGERTVPWGGCLGLNWAGRDSTIGHRSSQFSKQKYDYLYHSYN